MPARAWAGRCSQDAARSEIWFRSRSTGVDEFKRRDQPFANRERLGAGDAPRITNRPCTSTVATLKIPAGIQRRRTAFEVCPAEAVLVRTRGVAQLEAAEREDLERRCAVSRVACAFSMYHAADRLRTENTRYTAMCVPGELPDGADSTWFVYDLHARTSERIGAGAAAQEVAGRMARTANRTWRAEREGDRG